MEIKVICGDSFTTLDEFEENSFDSIITDPPYGINIVNAWWDQEVPSQAFWSKALRVIKPGGFVLAFTSPRLYHTAAIEIEKAGFQIIDQMMWIYSTGLVKNTKRLKNAHEPIVVARKPYEGTLEANFEKYGTGYLNIDDARIPWDKEPPKVPAGGMDRVAYGQKTEKTKVVLKDSNPLGRHPSNVIGDIEEPYSKYFYAPRATRKERGEFNNHPTPKPLALMEYLVKLYTPKKGKILDPFLGSGGTILAAKMLGYSCTGIEISEEYAEIAKKRLDSGILDIELD